MSHMETVKVPLWFASISFTKTYLSMQFLLAETGKLYGNAIWWALCGPSYGCFFNLLWADLQRILFCPIPYIWPVCIQMQRCNMQVIEKNVCCLYSYLIFHKNNDGSSAAKGLKFTCSLVEHGKTILTFFIVSLQIKRL